MIRINLLPVRAAKKKESIRFQLTVAGLVTFFVTALVGVFYFIVQGEAGQLADEIAAGEAELKALKKKIGELDKIQEEKRKVEEKLEIVNELEKGRSGPVELLVKVSEAIPDTAWLTSLKERGSLIVLRGIASSDDVVADFMKGLERQKGLGRVELEVAERRKVQGVDGYLVSFTLRIEKG
ncbi:MAG TPA: fimbrial protein [Deltaproteobacteria bacterium]|nr:fimbrial protein [Deltaproteobacteria bacterium]